MKTPKMQGRKLIHSGFLDICQDTLENVHGATLPFLVIVASDAVSILAETKEGLWITTKEYRHPTGKILTGLPGGTMNKGEDPLYCAQRELFEETGYWSDELVLMGSAHPFAAVCNQKIHYIFAKNAYKKSEPALEPFEFIEVELKTDAALRKEIQTSRQVDANLCTALWYKNLT